MRYIQPLKICSSEYRKVGDDKFYLQIGDKLMSANNKPTLFFLKKRPIEEKVKNIQYVDKDVEVFHLHLKENHNYFAGGLNVHNIKDFFRVVEK